MVQKIELLRWKAREELPDGSEDVAISHLTHALELKPDSPQLLLNRALFHMCKEDTDAAVCTVVLGFAETFWQ